MKSWRHRWRTEDGEVMLEALIVYAITVFLLFFLLAIFSVLFQSWNIQIIANETAARAAQTYKLAEADMVTGGVADPQDLLVPKYRYLLNNKELENQVRRKIEDYASGRLVRTTYTKQISEPQIEMTVEKDALARRHIEVRIAGNYAVPFGEALGYFGFDTVAHYDTVARAECLDLIDYIDTVDFAANQLSLDQLDSKLIGFINKILKLFEDIGSWIQG